MKSKTIKLVALIALLTGGFSISAQDIKTSSAFAIDKNIISFEVANLVDKVIYEHPSTPNYGGPNAFSPHSWTIVLIMAEGTDVTSLTPIITLASGVTITSNHAAVQDFSQQVDYTVIDENGSTVTYNFLAHAQEKTRIICGVDISYDPSKGGGTTFPSAGIHFYDENTLFTCTAIPNTPSYQFDKWEAYGGNYYYTNPFVAYLNAGTLRLTAIFKPAAQYTVTVQSEDTNRGTVSGGGTCYAGGNVSVSATPKQGWQVEGWYLNGSKISGSASFNYAPSASCTLIAKFTLIPPIITGPNLICSGSSQSFSASNWQSGFYWDKSSNLNLSSPTTNATVTVSANGTGAAYLYVKNSNGATIATHHVLVGVPLGGISATYSYSGNCIGYARISFHNTANFTVTEYGWEVTSGTVAPHPMGWDNIPGDMAMIINGRGSLYVKAKNDCGWSPRELVCNLTPCSSSSNVYPNPASNTVHIEMDAEAAKFSEHPTYDIRLYDSLGILLRQTKTKDDKVEFDVANLSNGFYYLHIYDGVSDAPEVQQIVVKH